MLYSVEDIYATLLGMLLEPFRVPGVENAFEPDSYCSREYSNMLLACSRLCERLNVQGEDEDIEIIIDSLRNMQQELCFRMFRLGCQFSCSNTAFV